jgi:hypothetical protein
MALSILKDLKKIYSSLNADEIRGAAHRDVSVGLMAATPAVLHDMEQFFAPAWLPEPERLEALRAVHAIDGTPSDRFDFVLAERGLPIPGNGFVYDVSDKHTLARSIASAHRQMDLALARRFPAFRPAVADSIIQRVARENALFSIATALPNVIPSVIDLPWSVGEFATDTAFLTTNQVRMALLMAAAHNQPVGYAEQKGQIGVIVAGAFGWRALARELVGKIPFGGGLIPKAAIAYAGTYVVGLGLEKLSRTGTGLSRSEQKDAYAEAYAKGKEVAKELAPTVTAKNQTPNVS